MYFSNSVLNNKKKKHINLKESSDKELDTDKIETAGDDIMICSSKQLHNRWGLVNDIQIIFYNTQKQIMSYVK